MEVCDFITPQILAAVSGAGCGDDLCEVEFIEGQVRALVQVLRLLNDGWKQRQGNGSKDRQSGAR